MKPKLFLVAMAAIGCVFSFQANAQSYAITNARIVTVSGATIERGTVVVRDGLIAAVGANVAAPADAQVFDGSGLTVYPGFIDAYTNLGIAARPTPAPTGPGGGGGQAAAAAAAAAAAQPSNSNYPSGFRPEYSTLEDVRSGDAQFEANRNAGFTSALTVGRTGIFPGQSALINLAGESVSGMTVASPVALHITFATIPGQYPGSLLGTFSALRQMFNDAKRHQELQRLYAANPRGMRRPEADKSLEALLPALNRQVPVVFTANRAIEIVRALDFAKEYNLRAIIAGGHDAAMFTDRLKAQDVPVLFSLNFPRRTTASAPDADPETMNTLRYRAEVPKVAGKLAAAGVKFAFQGGGSTSVNDFMANVVRSTQNGLSREAAVRAMTLSTAEIFGVSDRLGSIESGKIANLTVVRGDLLGEQKTVTHVFVDGKLFEPRPPAQGPGGRGPGAAGGPRPGGEGGPGAGTSGIAGTYAISIEAPGQTLSGTLSLIVQGTTVTGTLTTELGSSPIGDGRVTGNTINFSGSVMVGGAAIAYTVRATITGNQLSGSIDSPQGSLPITGTRNP
ncbi:MAG TPA: amidohydrolase family protein [Pyrinomonadaceae bacterium]|nr:amidohydrolase family protein [Pyrinomonadaceae bacterium]